MKAGIPRVLVRIFRSTVLIYILVCVGMFFMQRGMIFYPSRGPTISELTPWEVEGRVIGFAQTREQPSAVWLMFHGNAGRAAHRDYALRAMSEQDALYVMEYPGYGERTGTPSKTSFNEAAEEAYRVLRDIYPDTPLGVFGESIGSGPASHVATLEHPPDKVVLVVPFDSLVRVASNQFPFLPVGLLLRDRWDNMEALKHYGGPIEIFGAEQDVVIPMKHAKQLASTLPEARFTSFPSGHNDWSSAPEVQVRYP